MLVLRLTVAHNRKLLDAILHSLHLRGDHTQHLDGNAVELIEATPGACLGQASEDISHGLVVHLIRAVEHVARQGEGTCKIFGCLGLASSW